MEARVLQIPSDASPRFLQEVRVEFRGRADLAIGEIHEYWGLIDDTSDDALEKAVKKLEAAIEAITALRQVAERDDDDAVAAA